MLVGALDGCFAGGRLCCDPRFGGLGSELCKFSEALGDNSKSKFGPHAASHLGAEAPDLKMCLRCANSISTVARLALVLGLTSGLAAGCAKSGAYSCCWRVMWRVFVLEEASQRAVMVITLFVEGVCNWNVSAVPASLIMRISDWRRHARQGILSLLADLLPALPQADEGSAEPAFVPLAIAPDAIAVLDATAFPEAAGLSLGVIAVEIGADIVLG
jgi:hypothetical protein